MFVYWSSLDFCLLYKATKKRKGETYPDEQQKAGSEPSDLVFIAKWWMLFYILNKLNKWNNENLSLWFGMVYFELLWYKVFDSVWCPFKL